MPCLVSSGCRSSQNDLEVLDLAVALESSPVLDLSLNTGSRASRVRALPGPMMKIVHIRYVLLDRPLGLVRHYPRRGALGSAGFVQPLLALVGDGGPALLRGREVRIFDLAEPPDQPLPLGRVEEGLVLAPSASAVGVVAPEML